MSDFDYQMAAEKSRLLGTLKIQPVTIYSRAALYNILRDYDGQVQTDLNLQWNHSSGMGGTVFVPIESEIQKKAATLLLEEGKLVPTSIETDFTAIYQRITHFDDVNWGMNLEGEIIIFNLTDYDSIPDEVIRTDEKYAAALDILAQKRNDKRAVEDTPFKLKDGQEITPILTNPAAISLRARQQKGLITP